MNENEIELAKEQKEELIQNTIEKMNDAIDATMEYRFGEDWKNVEIEGFIENPTQGGFTDFSNGVDLDTVADLYKEKAEDFIREVASDFKADEDGFRDYSEKYDNKEDMLASLEATLNEQATYSNFSDSHNGAIDDMYNSNFSKHDTLEEAVSVGLERMEASETTSTKEGISDSEKTELIDIQNENIKSNLDDFMVEANSNLKDRFGEDFADLKVSDNQTLGDLSDMLEKKAGAYAEDNGLVFTKDESGQTVLENQRTGETFSDFDSAKREIEKTIEDDFSNMKDEKSLTVDAVFERANGKDETLDERVNSMNTENSSEQSFSKDQIDNFMEARENGSLERLEGETKEFELARDIASITDKNSGETEYVSSKEAFSQMIEDQSIDRDKIFEAANNLQNTGELEKAGEERLFNNAVEAVQNEGIDKSNEGLAIDTVKEFNTAYGNEASNERLAEMANDKFGTEFKAEDIQEIKNLDEKQMNGDVQIDRKEDLDMEKVKDLNSGKEIEVQGDHATVKEQTMAGEASERVVSREGGLDELDKTAGKDSDKVETKEESEKRDGLSAKEEEILKSINEDRKGSLNDAIDEYKSDSSNREVSVSQGQNNAESTKQK